MRAGKGPKASRARTGLKKEEETCSVQEPYEEEKNKDELSDSFRSWFCSLLLEPGAINRDLSQEG